MALATAAAYETIESGFSVDTLQCHFVSGPDPDLPIQMRVQRLSDGGRFVTRVITMEQNKTIMVHVTCSFVRVSAMNGPSMTHFVGRSTSDTINSMTLDDLETARTKQGPVMKYQRLPLVHTGPGSNASKSRPESLTYTSVATISPFITSSDPRLQSLGIIALSDYHVLDAPPTLHGLSFGLPAINDTNRAPTPHSFERYTSLNHTIRFHVHEGFRADDLCYIEVNSPWTNRRRAEVQSRIFDRKGLLVATCVQGSYYVMKDEKDGSKL